MSGAGGAKAEPRGVEQQPRAPEQEQPFPALRQLLLGGEAEHVLPEAVRQPGERVEERRVVVAAYLLAGEPPVLGDGVRVLDVRRAVVAAFVVERVGVPGDDERQPREAPREGDAVPAGLGTKEGEARPRTGAR